MNIIVTVTSGKGDEAGTLSDVLCLLGSLRGSEVETQMDAVSPKRVTDISCICLHFISIPGLSAPPPELQ